MSTIYRNWRSVEQFARVCEPGEHRDDAMSYYLAIAAECLRQLDQHTRPYDILAAERFAVLADRAEDIRLALDGKGDV